MGSRPRGTWPRFARNNQYNTAVQLWEGGSPIFARAKIRTVPYPQLKLWEGDSPIFARAKIWDSPHPQPRNP